MSHQSLLLIQVMEKFLRIESIEIDEKGQKIKRM
ncbi:MAG: hypothetical protein ETSY1_19610 [Candidatus Entotheonella factor]|uniref:Uncharacterized protein n=1 Tax=Entotheonella factor TaxID=1429438 RepID=W4LJD7_ENTF1|nr:MAG: hypothetical protein ETSY1_19610 [Candidatus Entotheonella factor]